MLDFGTDERIDLDDGYLRWWPRWLAVSDAQSLMVELVDGVPWEQSEIRIAGRRIAIPRLNAWYGDAGANYGYSGVRLPTRSWSPGLARLKAQVEAATGLGFNSALLNLYRDGRDSVDWHSDDEPELGKEPQVASVSLGQTRRFDLRRRDDRRQRYRLELQDGSLLLMGGALQHNWQHRLPKDPGAAGPRVNITFRRVEPQHQ